MEEGGAARRIVELPRAEQPQALDAGAAGPVDRATGLLGPVLALFATIALLAVFVFWGISRSSSALPYFAVPGALYVGAALLAARAWSRPWTRDAAARRHPPHR